LKNKTEKFKERAKKEKKEIKQDIPLKEIEIKAIELLNEYNTKSRLFSVISKEMDISDAVYGKILGMFIVDCINDMIKDYPEFEVYFNTNDKDIFDVKRVKKIFQNHIGKELREIFIEYLTSLG
jgi:hypothetical protein